MCFPMICSYEITNHPEVPVLHLKWFPFYFGDLLTNKKNIQTGQPSCKELIPESWSELLIKWQTDSKSSSFAEHSSSCRSNVSNCILEVITSGMVQVSSWASSSDGTKYGNSCWAKTSVIHFFHIFNIETLAIPHLCFKDKLINNHDKWKKKHKHGLEL